MKSVAEQFKELVAARIPAAKKCEMSLVAGNSKVPVLLTTEHCAEILQNELDLLASVAFDLREKLGYQATPEICKEFSQQVRVAVGAIKQRIKTHGRPSLETEKVLNRGVTEKLSKTLDQIKKAS